MTEITDYRVKESEEIDDLFSDLYDAKLFSSQVEFVDSCYEFYEKNKFITTSQRDALKRILGNANG